MLSLKTLYSRLTSVKPDEVINNALAQTLEALEKENKRQMYDGKTNKGVDITPSHFNDPYFKSPASAAAYSRWKDRITPNPRRTKGTPNLYINGFYYGTRTISITSGIIHHSSSFKGAADIERKFADIDGLGGKYHKTYVDDSLRPAFNAEVKKAIGLKFN